MEISYCDLKQKEVVNITDGKRLGRILDIVISLHSCKILGVVVAGNRKIFNTKEDIFIPWKCIQKIGDDVILISFAECNSDNVIFPNSAHNTCKPKHKPYQADSSQQILFEGANTRVFSESDE